ncbi:KilA-N domain-containing protein [Symbiopectobacterium purcellii]|uniref:KilA-N domain-containing protein n=1 Tax=Symbiopectobacterium purcellii TaxID=2871826 RepID=UPI003F87DC31
MSKLVVIENTVVRQDAFGRYCLNDLHRAAVAQGRATKSQRPSAFFKSKGTRKIAKSLGNIANRLKNDYILCPDMRQRSIAGCYQNNVAWL